MLRRSDIAPNRIGLWHKPQTPLFWQYALTAAAAFAGYAAHAGLEAWAGNGLPIFITFYPAVMIAALLWGIGPGLFATIGLNVTSMRRTVRLRHKHGDILANNLSGAVGISANDPLRRSVYETR
jgi:hypothetical protein